MTLSSQPSARALALTRAAAELDNDLVTAIVRQSVDDIGVMATWDRLVRPVWEHLSSGPGGISTAAEHVYVRSAFTALAIARPPGRENRNRPASVDVRSAGH